MFHETNDQKLARYPGARVEYCERGCTFRATVSQAYLHPRTGTVMLALSNGTDLPYWAANVVHPAPAPLERLRHHVTGAIERGEAEPITNLEG